MIASNRLVSSNHQQIYCLLAPAPISRTWLSALSAKTISHPWMRCTNSHGNPWTRRRCINSYVLRPRRTTTPSTASSNLTSKQLTPNPSRNQCWCDRGHVSMLTSSLQSRTYPLVWDNLRDARRGSVATISKKIWRPSWAKKVPLQWESTRHASQTEEFRPAGWTSTSRTSKARTPKILISKMLLWLYKDRYWLRKMSYAKK